MSLAAHAAQFGFLVFFENPRTYIIHWTSPACSDLHLDIERTYGQRKLLAQRSPIQLKTRKTQEDGHGRQASVSSIASTEASTPAATEGETATESEEPYTEVETETEIEEGTPVQQPKRFSLPSSTSSMSSSKENIHRVPKRQIISQHDLFHRYFRKDTVLLHNVDLLRCVFSSGSHRNRHR